MKKVDSSLWRIFGALVVGVVLVGWPDVAVTYLVLAIGVLFLLPGAVSLIGYVVAKPVEGVKRRFPIEGVGSLLLGLWLVIMPDFFTHTLMYLLGFVLVMGGVQQVVSLLMARSWMRVPSGFYIVPLLVMISGVLALLHPEEIRDSIFRILGCISLVYTASELVGWWRFTRRRPKPTPDAAIEEATIVEEE